MHGEGAEHARKVSGIVSTPLTDGQAAPALGAELRGMFSVATENRNIPHAMVRSDWMPPTGTIVQSSADGLDHVSTIFGPARNILPDPRMTPSSMLFMLAGLCGSEFARDNARSGSHRRNNFKRRAGEASTRQSPATG